MYVKVLRRNLCYSYKNHVLASLPCWDITICWYCFNFTSFLFTGQTCEAPPGIDNGEIVWVQQNTEISFTVGMTIAYVCFLGYHIDADDNQIECLPSKRWTEVPDCISMLVMTINFHSIHFWPRHCCQSYTRAIMTTEVFKRFGNLFSCPIFKGGSFIILVFKWLVVTGVFMLNQSGK